jgi:hypothetical protein
MVAREFVYGKEADGRDALSNWDGGMVVYEILWE